MDSRSWGNGRAGTGPGRIALLVQYDGTAFNGWQVQNSGRTVQGEIEKALKILLKKNNRVVASGRTDAGVHALGQVVHFECDNEIDLKRLCIGLNGILDRDVSVRNSYRVSPDFHARFSATGREYLYLIYNHPQRNPFNKYRAMWVNHGLDPEYLRKTASYLVGEKDFASFCRKNSAEGGTVRRITDIEVVKNEDYLIFRITANAFLHNMIRIIIGTMIDMFRNGLEEEYILDLLNKRDREYTGPTAPPYGLYLNSVMYDPPLSSAPSAF
jgi:tRNA pseudouridine38-40 synthase